MFLYKVKKQKVNSLHVGIAFLLIIIIALAIILFSTFDHEVVSYESSNTIMETDVNQMVYGDNGKVASVNAFGKIKKIFLKLIQEDSESEISEINDAAGKEWVDLSDKTLEILETYKDLEDKTGMLPDFKSLKINTDVKRAKLFDENAKINFSWILNGIACETAVEVYKKEGALSGIATVGRDVGVYGTKPNKKEWNIAIHDPLAKDNEYSNFAIVKVREGFLSTVSQSDINANRIVLPIDKPVENELVSVTVLHEKGFISDLLARICFALGKEKSLDILNCYDAKAIFVDKDRNVYISNKLSSSVITINKNCSIYELV